MLLRSLLCLSDVPRHELSREVLERRTMVTLVQDHDELWERIRTDVYDVAILDAAALGESPLSATRAIRAIVEAPTGPDIVLLARGDESMTNAYVAAGCTAVLSGKGSDDDLVAALEALITRARSKRVRRIVAGGRTERRLEAMGTRSIAIRRFHKATRRIAAGRSPVLIHGEPGAGKAWLGPVIHRESPRASGPFHSLRCASVPEETIESVLFGHTPTALPGPEHAGRGLIERAHGGTLFLEGLDEAPLAFQSKLLRYLERGKCRRVGGTGRWIRADVRLLASVTDQSHVGGQSETLLPELYQRVGLNCLTPPPLRDRPDDVPDLAATAHEKWRTRYGLAVDGFTTAAMDALQQHRWPGNVSELWSVIERSTLLSQGDRIGIDDLPADVAPPLKGGVGQELLAIDAPWLGDPSKLPTLRGLRDQALAVVERAYLVELLGSVGGRVADAARHADVDPRSLYSRMRQYGLRKETFKPLQRRRQPDPGGHTE